MTDKTIPSRDWLAEAVAYCQKDNELRSQAKTFKRDIATIQLKGLNEQNTSAETQIDNLATEMRIRLFELVWLNENRCHFVLSETVEKRLKSLLCLIHKAQILNEDRKEWYRQKRNLEAESMNTES